jgi:hypothetical protein
VRRRERWRERERDVERLAHSNNKSAVIHKNRRTCDVTIMYTLFGRRGNGVVEMFR